MDASWRTPTKQEGEEPTEDASALIAEAEAAVSQLRDLVGKINATNARLDLSADVTKTDELATRKALRLQHSVLTDAAGAASGASDHYPR